MHSAHILKLEHAWKIGKELQIIYAV